jgi:hypothetical protein
MAPGARGYEINVGTEAGVISWRLRHNALAAKAECGASLWHGRKPWICGPPVFTKLMPDCETVKRKSLFSRLGSFRHG